MDEIAKKLEERADAWDAMLNKPPTPSEMLTPNYAIATALRDVARIIRDCDHDGRKHDG